MRSSISRARARLRLLWPRAQDVEPRSGVALRGASRTQLALPVGPLRAQGATWLPRLRAVPLFPIAWYELGGEALPGVAWQLRVAAAAPGASATTKLRMRRSAQIHVPSL